MKAPHITTETPATESLRLDGGVANRTNLRFAGLVVFLLLVVASFHGPIGAMIGYAAGESLHSHIFLVPFISIYLIFLQRHDIPKVYQCSLGWGVAGLALGLTAAVIASLHRAELSQGDYLSLFAFAFVSLLMSGGFLFLGSRWMSATAFPVAFLFFAVPLPDTVVNWMETMLKLGSAEAANLFFNISGVPVLRDGVVFQLPGITLEVAQECSGIRSSWILFITSLVAAHLLLKSAWRRIALLAVVVPLAILRNGFRILVIGLLCVHVGPHMIHSFVHRSGGPIFFVLSLIPLFLLLWWLQKGERKSSSEQ